jgi:hypothetical protein
VCITTTALVLLAETYQRMNGNTQRPDTEYVRYVSSTTVRDADPSFQAAFSVVRVNSLGGSPEIFLDATDSDDI